MKEIISQNSFVLVPAKEGISFGCALAICISWSCYHSVVWAIVHGLCSWFFVIWWCLFGPAVPGT